MCSFKAGWLFVGQSWRRCGLSLYKASTGQRPPVPKDPHDPIPSHPHPPVRVPLSTVFLLDSRTYHLEKDFRRSKNESTGVVLGKEVGWGSDGF